MSKSVPASPVDPLRAWREWFVKSEREWSEALTRLMKEDATARAVGQEINAALYAQQMLKQGMAGSLATMNLPTQEQITALGERLGQLEDAVARIEVGLGQLREMLGAATTAEPRRGRRAPAAGPAPVEAGRAAAPAASRPRRAARKRRA